MRGVWYAFLVFGFWGEEGSWEGRGRKGKGGRGIGGSSGWGTRGRAVLL